MCRRLAAAAVALLAACASGAAVAQRLAVMSYNCENFFDTRRTLGHADGDFLPGGRMRWTRERLERKVAQVAAAIDSAVGGMPPELVLLQEVETGAVLRQLALHPRMRRHGYAYLLAPSRDPRGISVALLYAPRAFRLVGWRHFGLADGYLRANGYAPTRDILHATGVVATGDTLDVFVVHLPSRLGAGEGRAKRAELLRLLRASADSVAGVRAAANIVAGGDFNSAPRHLAPLRNLMVGLRGGSHKFRGRWEWLDQLLVSERMLRRGSGVALVPRSVRRVELPSLMERDRAYGESKPRRTYLGTHYHGGSSDHLPVVAEFRLGGAEARAE